MQIFFFSFLCVIKTFISSKEDKMKTDEISSIYKWAKKNNIYINENIQLYKNELNDVNHNFYYFKSNNDINNNTLLLKVPSNIMISQHFLDNFFKKQKNKKFSSLWDKISSIDEYLKYASAKQLFYISIIISDSTFRQKGKFYKKYKEYLDMYSYINLDNFPILYNAKEMLYLNYSNFGKEIKNNLKSINNEYFLIKNKLNLDRTVLVDEYAKYRILSLSNSVYINNKTYVVPFIDCFKKKVNKTFGNYNAYIKYSPNERNNKEYDLEIYSYGQIKSNTELFLLWKQISNIECLLYYGFVDEKNVITSEFLVDVINKNFKTDLAIDDINKKYNINFDDLIESKHYDLNNEFYHEYLYYAYRNLSIYFDKYYHNNEGPYQMMKDNLVYYLKLYEEMYNDDLININIEGKNKKINVKTVLRLEKKLIENRIQLLNNKINYFRNTKEEKDIYELLRRNDQIRKNKFVIENL